MAEHNRIGRLGEERAAVLLREKGYKIVATNWRLGHLEVDIIASNREEIVFVEVKTRTSLYGGNPEEAVDAQKRRHLTAAANAYIKYNNETRMPRFDIIGILMNKAGEIEDVHHFENAFSPPAKYRTAASFLGKWQWSKRK
jgi:putative endonuclease